MACILGDRKTKMASKCPACCGCQFRSQEITPWLSTFTGSYVHIFLGHAQKAFWVNKFEKQGDDFWLSILLSLILYSFHFAKIILTISRYLSTCTYLTYLYLRVCFGHHFDAVLVNVNTVFLLEWRPVRPSDGIIRPMADTICPKSLQKR
jgi:hypothetical protein